MCVCSSPCVALVLRLCFVLCILWAARLETCCSNPIYAMPYRIDYHLSVASMWVCALFFLCCCISLRLHFSFVRFDHLEWVFAYECIGGTHGYVLRCLFFRPVLSSFAIANQYMNGEEIILNPFLTVWTWPTGIFRVRRFVCVFCVQSPLFSAVHISVMCLNIL